MTDQPTTRLVHAPWNAEQVTALNAFQHTGRMHPFTCGAEHASGQSPMLVATNSGWVCPDPQCTYRQDWAHAFMAQPAVPVSSPPPDQTALRDRGAKAEALLLRFTAEAHRRKWNYDRGLDDDGQPIKSEAFDALHRLGDEMNAELRKLRATPAAVLPPPAARAAVLNAAADFAEEVAEKLRAHHEFERSTGALDVMTELRRLAAEAPQPFESTPDCHTGPKAAPKAAEAQQPGTETPSSWTPGPVALARAADWATKRQDATVDPAMCPRCKGDNSEAFQLCAACATPEPPVHKGGNADDCPACQTDGLDTIGPPYECPGGETTA